VTGEIYYSRSAGEALDKIEADPDSGQLWNAICDAIELVADHPESAAARRQALRTAAGTTVWKVSVRAPQETADWMILWSMDDKGRVLVAYIGTL